MATDITGILSNNENKEELLSIVNDESAAETQTCSENDPYTAIKDEYDKKPWITFKARDELTGNLKVIEPNIIKALLILSLITDLAWDDFSGRIIIRSEKGYRFYNDADANRIWLELVNTYWFTRAIPLSMVKNIIEAFVQKYNKTNTACEYFKRLKWDGKKRAATLLIDNYGAEDNIFTREATYIWLMACIRRVFSPYPVKFDNMLVLQGIQGTYKTSFFTALATRPEWFVRFNGDHIGKNRQIGMDGCGKIFVNFAELDRIDKRGQEALKTFLDSSVDTFDAKYEKYSTDKIRRFVIGGDSNKHDFLKDETGSRRFWVVPINKPGEVFSEANPERYALVEQIWAEIMHDFRANPNIPLKLSDEAEEIRKKVNKDYTAVGYEDYITQIHDFLDVNNLTYVTPKRLFDITKNDIFGVNEFKQPYKSFMYNILRELGYEKSNKVVRCPVSNPWWGGISDRWWIRTR